MAIVHFLLDWIPHILSSPLPPPPWSFIFPQSHQQRKNNEGRTTVPTNDSSDLCLRSIDFAITDSLLDPPLLITAPPEVVQHLFLCPSNDLSTVLSLLQPIGFAPQPQKIPHMKIHTYCSWLQSICSSLQTFLLLSPLITVHWPPSPLFATY